MINGILGKSFPDAAIISHEVHDRLKDFRYDCMEVYYQLQLQFTVEEDWIVPGIYIVGRINADVCKIREVVEPKLRSGTFDQAWNGLLRSGVVEVTEEGIALPLLGGKLYTLEKLQEQIASQRSQLEKTEPAQEGLLQGNNTLSLAVAEVKREIERNLGVADDVQ